MAIVREAAQVVCLNLDKPRRARTPQNPVVKRAGKKIGKDRDDVKAHRR